MVEWVNTSLDLPNFVSSTWTTPLARSMSLTIRWHASPGRIPVAASRPIRVRHVTALNRGDKVSAAARSARTSASLNTFGSLGRYRRLQIASGGICVAGSSAC